MIKSYIKTVFSWFFFLITIVSCTQSEAKKIEVQDLVEAAIDTTWMQLSLREKIGQIVCLQYDRNQITAFESNSSVGFFEKYPVGAVFLANWELNKFSNKDGIKDEYIKTVKELSDASKYPLLFSEDFELGLGSIISGYTELPGEMSIGAANSVKYAQWYGEIIAQESRSIGINWLLHPVADLNKNPFNFLTNVRATGDDENLAIKLLPAQVAGMRKFNVAATAKHFPGDGTDFTNQHFTTSIMKLSVEEWEQQHGAVFKKLIGNGVSTIMAGHISFPKYQKEQLNGEFLPATLSKELMIDLLKKKLNFKGVVVSDALNMGGISGYYKTQLETEIESFKAGTDVLLWPNIEIIDTLEAKFLRKEIPINRLNDAVSRVWNLKKKLGLFKEDYQIVKPITEEDLVDNNKKGYEIAQHAITMLSNKNNIIPFNTDTSKKILLVVISENDEASTFEILKNEFEAKGFDVDMRYNLSFFENGNELQNISKTYDKIIFNYYAMPGKPWGSLSLNGNEALTMWSSNKLPFEKVISVGFGDPYKNMTYLPRIWCRINCYNADKNTFKALVKGLLGEIEFTGTSPVKLP